MYVLCVRTIYVRVCVLVIVPKHGHVEVRGQCWVSFSVTLCSGFETGSVMGLEACCFGTSVWALTPDDPPVAVSQCWGYRHVCHHVHLLGGR